MKKIFFLVTIILIGGTIFFLSCKKEYSCEKCIGNNKPPIAIAGNDTAITFPLDSVLLDGSKSSDPDGKISEWKWTKIAGPASVTIANANAVTTQVSNLIQGVYQFELKVTDAGGLFSKDTIQIFVNPVSGIVDCNGILRPLVNAQLKPIGTLSQTRTDVAVASAGNKILFAGGLIPGTPSSFSSRVDIFDITTNSWTTAELSQARFGVIPAVHGNKIFFAGGYGSGYGSSRVDIYDAIVDTWTTADLRDARGEMGGAAAGNKVLFGGGFNWGNVTTDPFPTIVDIYDASNNSWSSSSLTDRPAGVTSGIAATAIGNKIYLAGGYDLFENRATSKINIYDASNNTWSTSDLSIARGNMASIAVGNKNYWAGGSSKTEFANEMVEIRDMNSGSSTFDCLFQPNATFSAVLKYNKIVFFTGYGAEKNKFDIYDIATNTWSVGVLPQSITAAAIISVNNTVYVAGGKVNGVLSDKVWKLEY
jgi:N-acetylneuraminic acid mutarotase